MRRCRFLGIPRGAVTWAQRTALRASITSSISLPLGLGALPASAWAQQQPVTAAELVGYVMKVSVTHDRVMRRDGRQFPNTYQTDWTIDFVSENTIRQIFVATSSTPRGVSKTPPEGRLITLGRPIETGTRGGGHVLWIFDAGVLTFLRTYEGGGMKGSVAVTRSSEGFNCAANISWPREIGVPTIVLRSFVDNSRVEIISAKQTGSSCSIAKGTGGDGQKP